MDSFDMEALNRQFFESAAFSEFQAGVVLEPLNGGLTLSFGSRKYTYPKEKKAQMSYGTNAAASSGQYERAETNAVHQ
ncbi:hypothetical protein Avbf_00645 [Armadillidium vulgare]|nr:hypothetical protein Avbf_00645 [Armadillidium vulgare]